MVVYSSIHIQFPHFCANATSSLTIYSASVLSPCSRVIERGRGGTYYVQWLVTYCKTVRETCTPPLSNTRIGGWMSKILLLLGGKCGAPIPRVVGGHIYSQYILQYSLKSHAQKYTLHLLLKTTFIGYHSLRNTKVVFTLLTAACWVESIAPNAIEVVVSETAACSADCECRQTKTREGAVQVLSTIAIAHCQGRPSTELTHVMHARSIAVYGTHSHSMKMERGGGCF